MCMATWSFKNYFSIINIRAFHLRSELNLMSLQWYDGNFKLGIFSFTKLVCFSLCRLLSSLPILWHHGLVCHLNWHAWSLLLVTGWKGIAADVQLMNSMHLRSHTIVKYLQLSYLGFLGLLIFYWLQWFCHLYWFSSSLATLFTVIRWVKHHLGSYIFIAIVMFSVAKFLVLYETSMVNPFTFYGK